jgi:hypothetical protein
MKNGIDVEQIDAWAAEIRDRGFAQPAALLMTAFTPFSWVFGQFYYFSQPFLATLLPEKDQEVIRTLLQDANAWKEFAERLNDPRGSENG